MGIKTFSHTQDDMHVYTCAHKAYTHMHMCIYIYTYLCTCIFKYDKT